MIQIIFLITNPNIEIVWEEPFKNNIKYCIKNQIKYNLSYQDQLLTTHIKNPAQQEELNNIFLKVKDDSKFFNVTSNFK